LNNKSDCKMYVIILRNEFGSLRPIDGDNTISESVNHDSFKGFGQKY